MERIARLREQATILRALAGTFDTPTIRDQLLDLAVRCDELAKAAEENPPEKMTGSARWAEPRGLLALLLLRVLDQQCALLKLAGVGQERCGDFVVSGVLCHLHTTPRFIA
jgi:hypothetical protein